MKRRLETLPTPPGSYFHPIASVCKLAHLTCVAAGLLGSIGAAGAQYDDVKQISKRSPIDVSEVEQRRELVVAALRSTGDPIPSGPDGRPIHERFTGALRDHMSSLAGDLYTVRDGPAVGQSPGSRPRPFERPSRDVVRDRPAAGRPAPYLRLKLEGDMAYLKNDEAGGRSYACTFRLFDEGRPRRLLAHWSATAQTLRDLTSNLSHDRRVHPLGLLGEIGLRVHRAILSLDSDDIRVRVEALVRQTPDADRPMVTVLSDGRTLKEDRPGAGFVLDRGSRYSLNVRARQDGLLFLIAVPGSGSPESLIPEGLPIARNREYPVGGSEDFTVPRGVGTMRLIALVHLDSGEGDNAPAQDPRTGPVQGGANDNIKESSTRPKSSPAVEVIGTESVTADPDAQLMRLLAGIAQDKPGSWVAGLANVRIAPAP